MIRGSLEGGDDVTRTFDLPYGIACLPVPLAAWNFGTPKSFFSIRCQLDL